jgi:rhodanese-related sulfurtransferase
MPKTVMDLVTEARAQIENLSAEDALKEIASGNAILVDVREPLEWEHHIEGALQIPRGLLEFVADPECGPRLPPSLKFDMNPSSRVIIYCNTGGRGALAAHTLKILGYEHVANLDGGLNAWKEAGLPISEHHSGLI